MTRQNESLQENPPRQGVGAAFLHFARPHRWTVALAVLLGAAANLSITLGPLMVGRLTDALLEQDRAAVVWWGIGGLVIGLVSPALSMTSRERLAAAGEYIICDVRNAVAQGLAYVPLRFIERHRRGELIQRSTAEVAALSVFVRESLTELLMTTANVVFFVVLLATQSWLLLLALLFSFVPLSMFVMFRFRRQSSHVFGAEAQAEADVAADLAESIRLRSVIADAPEITRRRLGLRSRALNDAAIHAQMRTVILSRWVGATTLIEGLALAVLLFFGCLLVSHDVVSVGVVVTFVLASVTLFSSFSDLMALVGSLEEVLTGAARVNQLLDRTAVREGVSAASGLARIDPATSASIELRNVTFGYGNSPAVHDVSLRISPGERVGLAGPSGSGKSTLAMLIAGLYSPDSGWVRCGGVDVGVLSPHERCDMVALVPQEIHLGRTSLAEELRLVAPEADDATLLGAFDTLGLREWVTTLPEGLKTPLGDNSTLSVGERQLVGLARVVLRDSRVIVLDETTSDLDPSVAELVECAIDELSQDRTVIVVAHRPATLSRMDRIIEMRDGRVLSEDV